MPHICALEALLLVVAVALLSAPAPVDAAIVNLQYTTGSPRVLNCDTGATSATDCDPEGYRLLLTVIAAPGIAGSCIVLLLLVVYFISKYLCNCCGGRQQHPNMCCPNVSLPAKYSKTDLVRPRFYAVLVFGLCLGGCVWGGTAATHLRSQITTMRSSTDSGVTVLQNVTQQAPITLQSVLLSANMSADVRAELSPSLANFAQAGDAVSDELQRMADTTILSVTHYLTKFLWSVYVAFVLLVVGAVVGLWAAFCHQRLYLPMVLVVFFGVIGGMGTWGIYAAALVGERVMDDTCHEVNAYVTGQSNVVVAATGCNDTLLTAFGSSLQGAVDTLTQAACTALLPMCYQANLTVLENVAHSRMFDCASAAINSVATCQTKTLRELRSLTQAPSIWSNTQALSTAQSLGSVCSGSNGSTASATTCTLEACSTLCTIGTTQSAFADTVGQVIDEFQSATTLKQTVYRVSQLSVVTHCSAVLDTTVPPLQGPCATGTHWIFAVRQSAGFMALVSVIAVCTYIVGAKRFIPLSQALVPQYG